MSMPEVERVIYSDKYIIHKINAADGHIYIRIYDQNNDQLCAALSTYYPGWNGIISQWAHSVCESDIKLLQNCIKYLEIYLNDFTNSIMLEDWIRQYHADG